MLVNINNGGNCELPDGCEGLGLLFGTVDSNLLVERTYAEGKLSYSAWRTGAIGGVGNDAIHPLLECTFATRLTTDNG